MEVAGYIIAGFTFVVGLIIQLARNVDTKLVDAKGTIKDEFTFAYRELGTVAGGKDRESRMLDMCVDRVKRLHCSSPLDLLELKIIDWVLGKASLLVYSVIALVIVSLIVGHIEIPEKRGVLRLMSFVVIPCVLLFTQTLFMCWIIRKERYLKRMIERYKRSEY